MRACYVDRCAMYSHRVTPSPSQTRSTRARYEPAEDAWLSVVSPLSLGVRASRGLRGCQPHAGESLDDCSPPALLRFATGSRVATVRMVRLEDRPTYAFGSRRVRELPDVGSPARALGIKRFSVVGHPLGDAVSATANRTETASGRPCGPCTPPDQVRSEVNLTAERRESRRTSDDGSRWHGS
jgi:hypothetical protein